MNFTDRVCEAGIVPVVVLNRVEDAVPLAGALLKGGITFMEITFRTECAADCIEVIRREVPDMTVGAGTVINVEQAKTAVAGGAKFIVSPGFDEETVRWALDNDIPVIPGTVTPTEIMKAVGMGLRVLKFFPADVYGGIKAIKALSAPFGQVRFLLLRRLLRLRQHDVVTGVTLHQSRAHRLAEDAPQRDEQDTTVRRAHIEVREPVGQHKVVEMLQRDLP